MVEEEAEIIIKEVVDGGNGFNGIMVSLVGMSLSLVNLARLDLQDFWGNQVRMGDFKDNQVRIKDHSARFVERVAIQLLIATIGWIFLSREDMLHQNWQQWWLIQLRFMGQMVGSQTLVIQIM